MLGSNYMELKGYCGVVVFAMFNITGIIANALRNTVIDISTHGCNILFKLTPSVTQTLMGFSF